MSTKRVAVIGLGWRIARVLIAMKEVGWDFRVVGYGDPSPGGLPMLAPAEIDPGERFASTDEMFEAGPFDLVMIGSPNHLHLEHLKAAFAAGYPIFCEKPVVRTEQESIDLARILTGSDAIPPLYIGLVLRSMPLVREVIRHVEGGLLGDLISIDATEFLVPEHGAYLARNWRRRSEWGGSFMLDKACHDFDIFNWATQARAAKVVSMGGRGIFKSERAQKQRHYEDGRPAYELAQGGWSSAGDAFSSDMDVLDHQVAMVEYDNGVRLTFHSNSHSAIPERRWVFMGTEGALIANLSRNTLLFQHALASTTDGGFTTPEPLEVDFGALEHLSHNGADYAMARDLLASLDGEATYPVSVWDSIEAGLTVMAIDRSLAVGEIIDCTPIWEEFDAAKRGALTVGHPA
jgi:predicted dehydrogenase